jgi:uncharacterized protein YecE (DUF72 family)
VGSHSPELAIVRLHGRNVDTWAKKGLTSSSQRFNYDYSEAELAEIAHSVATLAREVPVTHVVLNNNYEDQGQTQRQDAHRAPQAAAGLKAWGARRSGFPV